MQPRSQEETLKTISADLGSKKGFNTLDILKMLQRLQVRSTAVTEKSRAFRSTIGLERTASEALTTLKHSAAMTDGLNQLANNSHTASAEFIRLVESGQKEDNPQVRAQRTVELEALRKQIAQLATLQEGTTRKFLKLSEDLHKALPDLFQQLAANKTSSPELLSKLQAYAAEFTRIKEEAAVLITKQNALWNPLETLARRGAQDILDKGIKIPPVDRPHID
jgi:hypothetical protein